MAIANAFIVPRKKNYAGKLNKMLRSLYGVEVQDTSDKGIMVVLKYDDIFRLSELAEVISGWDNVLDFQLTDFHLSRGGGNSTTEKQKPSVRTGRKSAGH
jgi:nitrate reductase NapAB chaperone NapD